MQHRTRKYLITRTMGLSVAEAIPMNPLRKALIFNPLLCCASGTQQITAVVFNAGIGQQWAVPAGVTSIIDAYVWGAGGAAGIGVDGNGGGGGGGGGFASAGPLTVVPGSVLTVNVAVNAVDSASTLLSASATLVASANSGTAGSDSGGGAGGTATTGVVLKPGGAGANGNSSVKVGGGGGGAGGNATNGSTATTSAGGAGGGVATIAGYGKGGAGGAGGTAGGNGIAGVAPGGGGGGNDGEGNASGAGADGMIVIFYPTPCCQQGLSLSPNPSLTYGNGVINLTDWIGYPIILTDNDFGSILGEPWYGIAGIAGRVLNVLDVSYEQMEIDKEF